jgi:putative endopeptidase
MKNRFLLIVIIGAIVYSCKTKNETETKDPIDLSARDTTVRPQDNFFLYANGNWIKNTTIPASQPAWGAIFSLGDKSVQRMHEILDSVSKLTNAAKGSIEQLTGDLYASAMDSANIEKSGSAPLKPDLDRIAAIKDLPGIIDETVLEYSTGHNPFFSFSASADDKNSAMCVAHFYQGGLGLPNKDYYFKQDSSIKKIRDAYEAYMKKIFTLIGDDSSTAGKAAAEVLAFETALAKVSKSPVELRDPVANYHKLTIHDLDKLTPGLNWESLLAKMKIKQDTVIAGQPEFYTGLDKALHSTPVNTLKNYLRFHLADDYAGYLSNDFVNAEFAYSHLLSGQKQMQERWKRMSRMIDRQLGDALGQLYVQRYFPPEAKQRILDLVNNIIETYSERIKQLDWMSDSTKQKALVKLHAIVKKIGYPDKWKDYSSISIGRNNIIENLHNCGIYEYNRAINKIGKPVDKSEWYMTPPTVDAYYNPTANDINFPAGILQPPFFFVNGDDAVNYGAIGLVIGHEITHGFDDQGRQYDANGNLKDWWSPEDAQKFKQKASYIVKQYDQYLVVDTFHLNGSLTEGENIADNGGEAIAYAAFKKTEEGKSNKITDGLTADQRFFMATAQVWRVKVRDEALRSMVLSNPHSTPMYRVNGPVSNLPAFYSAFDVKPGDKMYRPDSVHVNIW